MTKKDIVQKLSEKLKLNPNEAKEAVQVVFDSIIDAVAEEGRLELRNFGIFEVKTRAAREGRNPKTEEKVFVPAKCVVVFKAGKVMKERAAERIQQSKPVQEDVAAASGSEQAEN